MFWTHFYGMLAIPTHKIHKNTFSDWNADFIPNRNHFLSDAIPNLSINFNQKISIDYFKFVGRNYCRLVDITDQLNSCYALHVIVFLELTAIDYCILINSIRFQMILNTAFTFMGSVFCFYALFRRIIQQNRLYEPLIWIHVNWLTFYLASICLAIHVAVQLTNEVWLN